MVRRDQRDRRELPVLMEQLDQQAQRGLLAPTGLPAQLGLAPQDPRDLLEDRQAQPALAQLALLVQQGQQVWVLPAPRDQQVLPHIPARVLQQLRGKQHLQLLTQLGMLKFMLMAYY